MKTNAITEDFFKGTIPESISAMGAGEMPMAFEDVSSMMTEALVILDFHQKNFLFMSNHNLSLGGFTLENSKEHGYDFFKKTIHPDDLPFWIDVHHAIIDSLNNDVLPADKVNYFSFLLRVRSAFSFKKKTDYLMIYVKMKPKWINEQLRYGICLLSASVMRKPNRHLHVHYINKGHSEYSFQTQKWTHHPFSLLSERNREMLVWAQQGLSIKETADKMDVITKTIEKMRQNLFGKWEVNSIEQAIQYANNRRLLYHPPPNKPSG